MIKSIAIGKLYWTFENTIAEEGNWNYDKRMPVQVEILEQRSDSWYVGAVINGFGLRTGIDKTGTCLVQREHLYDTEDAALEEFFKHCAKKQRKFDNLMEQVVSRQAELEKARKNKKGGRK